MCLISVRHDFLFFFRGGGEGGGGGLLLVSVHKEVDIKPFSIQSVFFIRLLYLTIAPFISSGGVSRPTRDMSFFFPACLCNSSRASIMV